MIKPIALTHAPSPALQACERTFIAREPIDFDIAERQFNQYCQTLQDAGYEVRTLHVNRSFPDSAFIEDVAVALDEFILLASMGTASRRPEPLGVEPVLNEFGPVDRVEFPSTLEGGDVLRIGRQLLVGLSCRTNAAGIEQLATAASRYNYSVRTVPVLGCLHFKTACTALPDGRLLVNPNWIDILALTGFEMVRVPADEPWGANVLLLGSRVLMPAAHTQTAELIERLGFGVLRVDLSEFAKAEAGATCLSLLLPPRRE